MLFGVVSHFGKLVFSIDREDDRIQIEDQGGSGLGQGKQLSSKLIVQGDELADGFGGKPFEKSPNGGLIGKAGEPQQGKGDSVVLQNFGFVDSSQTGHDGIQESEKKIGGEVVCISLREMNRSLQ